MSVDGQTVAIGSNNNDGRGIKSGHVHICALDNKEDKKRLQVGCDIDGGNK